MPALPDAHIRDDTVERTVDAIIVLVFDSVASTTCSYTKQEEEYWERRVSEEIRRRRRRKKKCNQQYTIICVRYGASQQLVFIIIIIIAIIVITRQSTTALNVSGGIFGRRVRSANIRSDVAMACLPDEISDASLRIFRDGDRAQSSASSPYCRDNVPPMIPNARNP